MVWMNMKIYKSTMLSSLLIKYLLSTTIFLKIIFYLSADPKLAWNQSSYRKNAHEFMVDNISVNISVTHY